MKSKVINSTLLFLIGFVSCSTKVEYKWFEHNGKLILDSFYSDGSLSCRQFLLNDSLTKKRSSSYYYSNGNIEKWLWFDVNFKYPIGGVYYDTNGHLESIGGDGFLKIDNTNDIFNFELMGPPNCKVMLVIKDSFKNDLVEDLNLAPINTDSSLYARTKLNIRRNHRYIAIYKIEDTISNITLAKGLPLIVTDTSFVSSEPR
jgi:hypothetical protein